MTKTAQQNGWKEARLGDYISIKHGFAFKGEYFTEEENANVLLSPGNFNIGGGFKADKFKYYNGEIPEDYVLKSDDLIVTMTDLSKEGDTLGYPAKIPQFNGRKYLHNQRLGLVQFKSNEIDKDFLYYLMCTHNYQQSIVNSATGSTVRHTSPTRIASYEFLLPPLLEQRAIAAILTALDYKIELLRRQNETLEALAQGLFKEWFVDFNFPNEQRRPYKKSGGRMIDSELGEVPECWRAGKLGEIAFLKSGFAFKGNDFVDKSNGRVLKIKDLKGNGKVDLTHVSFVTDEAIKQERVKQFELNSGDIVLAMSGNTTGKIGVIPDQVKNLFLNQRVGKFFMKDKIFRNFLYLFLMSGDYESVISSMGYGSAQPNINPTQVENIDIVFPNNEIVEQFENIASPIMKKIAKNTLQIQTLSALRDQLLPRLMRGEMRFTKTIK